MRADRISLVLVYTLAAVGVAPAILNVLPIYAVLLAAFVAVGLYWDLTDQYPLSSWILNLLVIIGLLAALALPSANGFVGRLLSGSILLLGGKLLAPKAARDMLQVMLLSLLLLIGSAILSASVAFAPLFIAYLLLCTVTLLWIPLGTAMERQSVSAAFAKRVGSVAALLVVGSIPLLLVFFIALPRTPAPLWRGVAPTGAQVSGFSDRVSLGDVARIAKNPSVAFRAELPGRSGPLASAPYWRGLVLEATDGFTWTPRTPAPQETLSRPLPAEGGSEPPVRQRIYLEPHGQTALFGLDRVSSIDSVLPPTTLSEGVLRTARPVTSRIAYDPVSDPSPYLAVEPDPLVLAANLTLPPGLPPIVAGTARQVVGEERDPYRKAILLVGYFHSGYTYSLDTPPGEGHPLEVFIGQTKTGYCEYFASAMALMLRSQGVPARLVAGYLGGDYNSTGSYYLVRQLSAHTWVEAYIDGRGWLRLDPTPPDQGPASPGAVDPPSGAYLAVDWVRLKWQSLVLGYDLERQISFFNTLAAAVVSPFRWRPGVDGPANLIALALLILTVTAVIVLWRRGGDENEEAALYRRMLRRLRRRGLQRDPAEGPLDFATRASATLPDRTEAIERLTFCYLDARYGSRRATREDLRRLGRMVRSL